MRVPWRRLAATMLIADAVINALWVAGLLPSLGGRDLSSVALVALRGAAAALGLVSGWLLATNREPGPVLAPWAFGSAALLTSVGLGFDLTPTNLDPAFRTPAIVASWIVAALGIWMARQGREPRG